MIQLTVQEFQGLLDLLRRAPLSRVEALWVQGFVAVKMAEAEQAQDEQPWSESNGEGAGQ